MECKASSHAVCQCATLDTHQHPAEFVTFFECCIHARGRCLFARKFRLDSGQADIQETLSRNRFAGLNKYIYIYLQERVNPEKLLPEELVVQQREEGGRGNKTKQNEKKNTLFISTGERAAQSPVEPTRLAFVHDRK